MIRHVLWYIVWPTLWYVVLLGYMLHELRGKTLYSAWTWYGYVQLIMGLATFLGLFILPWFCMARAWRECGSPFDKTRQIDRWSWEPLNAVYGNPEDGVSGRYAKVWYFDGKHDAVQVPYMPNAREWWRAYCWSAWRNSAGNLKYVFAWDKGPQATWRGRKLGWWPENGYKVPVL